jgi:thiol-disulfide isomerase/thioredoxin
MKKKIQLLIGFAVVFGFLSKSIAQPAFAVKTLDNKSIDLAKAIPQNTASVFVFLMPDCPLCENYTLSLKKLEKEYIGKKVQFYLVFSGTLFTKAEIEAYLQEFSLKFMVIHDTSMRLARILGAEVTPQAVVVNAKFKRLYNGKIDNWIAENRQHRTVVTAFYLEAALREILENKPVSIPYTQPVGCFIQ